LEIHVAKLQKNLSPLSGAKTQSKQFFVAVFKAGFAPLRLPTSRDKFGAKTKNERATTKNDVRAKSLMRDTPLCI
jgi:hypothetical protein